MALPLRVETQDLVSAPVRVALLATLLVAACSGGPSNVASHTPSAPATSPSASPSGSSNASATPSPVAGPTSTPQPVTGAYGVLVGNQAASTYTVSVIGVDGKVAASASASTPASPSCAGAAAAPVPLPVSTSNTRVYYMDAQGVIRFLAPDGSSGQVASVPVPTASRRATFAVSPDDQRIAVVVADYSSTGASTRLYVENLSGGGAHVDLFSQTGAHTLWAYGWHGTNNLVVAVVISCTQGGGPLCCGPTELHVVDPATANRRFTIGGPACRIAGPASSAGAVCEDTTGFTNASEVNWTAGVFGSFQIPGARAAFISPDGSLVAVVDTGGGVTNVRVATTVQMLACGWIDSSHLLAGGDAQQQPRIGDLTHNTISPVAAQGDCGGRIPGGL